MSYKKICVMGLGYIGLPTSAMFAKHGCMVHGVDVNQKVVDSLNLGKIVIEEPNLDILVKEAVDSNTLKAGLKPVKSDVFIIAVPTPMNNDKTANMDYVIKAAQSIVPYLEKGNTVILESTSPAGTVENLLVPILEKSGLEIGQDLYVGHSPERVLPGKILTELVNNTRIVGGVNEKSSKVIRDIYNIFVKSDIYLTDATTAEMCKMMENTYRDVNIALANELAMICEDNDINAWEVINLSNKHPRVNLHQPGPGVGGHCLAVDPWFIVEKNPDLSKIIKLSRTTNEGMPLYVFNKINKILENIKDKKVITILGISYKPNIDDLRESPIIKIIELLEENGYEVRIYDPHVTSYKDLSEDSVKAAKESDLILLGVNHDEFYQLPLDKMGNVMRNKNILDTRNFFDKEMVKEKGFIYYLLGDNSKK